MWVYKRNDLNRYEVSSIYCNNILKFRSDYYHFVWRSLFKRVQKENEIHEILYITYEDFFPNRWRDHLYKTPHLADPPETVGKKCFHRCLNCPLNLIKSLLYLSDPGLNS